MPSECRIDRVKTNLVILTINKESGSSSLSIGRLFVCRTSAKEQSDCDDFENNLLSQCPLTFDFANSAILLGLTYLLGHMYVRVYIYIRAHMYARCKYYISVNAPKKSVLAGFPTQTHLKAGGAKLRLRLSSSNSFNDDLIDQHLPPSVSSALEVDARATPFPSKAITNSTEQP